MKSLSKKQQMFPPKYGERCPLYLGFFYGQCWHWAGHFLKNEACHRWLPSLCRSARSPLPSSTTASKGAILGSWVPPDRISLALTLLGQEGLVSGIIWILLLPNQQITSVSSRLFSRLVMCLFWLWRSSSVACGDGWVIVKIFSWVQVAKFNVWSSGRGECKNCRLVSECYLAFWVLA